MKKILASPLFPLAIALIIFLMAYFCKKWENPLIAAGTVGVVVTAVWTIYYREIKAHEDRPILKMEEPCFDPPFYRQAPEIKIAIVNDKMVQEPGGIGYYINILLKNTGNRTAKNCQPLLIGMWEIVQGDWQKEKIGFLCL